LSGEHALLAGAKPRGGKRSQFVNGLLCRSLLLRAWQASLVVQVGGIPLQETELNPHADAFLMLAQRYLDLPE
jgi:hypothetical protein